MSLLGRFLSCLVAVGSTGDILKLACRFFLDCAMSSVLNVWVIPLVH